MGEVLWIRRDSSNEQQQERRSPMKPSKNNGPTSLPGDEAGYQINAVAGSLTPIGQPSIRFHQPPLTTDLRIMVEGAPGASIGWLQKQPAKGLVLAIHNSGSCMPLRLGQLTALARSEEVALDLSIVPTIQQPGFKVAVGRLLLASEKSAPVLDLLPSYHLAKLGEPCSICSAVNAPVGKHRSCLIGQNTADGLVICRFMEDGAIARTNGNKEPGYVHAFEPFDSIVEVRP